jgi:putative aldouronate transport system permease protein
MIFLSDGSKQPLQIYLRRILIEVSAEIQRNLPGSSYERAAYGIQLKYSSIIVTILPIICVYPFLQKYFVKGVMIGSIKG